MNAVSRAERLQRRGLVGEPSHDKRQRSIVHCASPIRAELARRRFTKGGKMFAKKISLTLLATFITGCAWFKLSLARDVPYVPTPEIVVEKMLELAQVGPDDVIYDLGSGDGRIVITAAKKYGARGLGVDIDPERVKEARENAEKEGVSDRVKFREGNLFEMDLSGASVVTLYLLQSINMKLRPKLLAELKPGTRVVSHSFDMGDWKPEKEVEIEGRKIYYWTVPEKKAQ
jgi:hypothetical protein